MRGIPSIRQNAYRARAASSGGSTTISLIAVWAGSAVNSAIGIRYSQPDWGSAANGRPDRMWGSQSGTWPLERLCPRYPQVGTHSSRRSLPTIGVRTYQPWIRYAQMIVSAAGAASPRTAVVRRGYDREMG